MMDSMRNAAKGWVAKLLIGLLAVSFGVWGIADVFSGRSRGALATVGSAEISADQYSRAFQQYLQNFSRQTGQGLTPEQARGLGIDRAVLNNLIQSAAVDNQMERKKLNVSQAFIEDEIKSNPAFQNNGVYDPEAFKRFLGNAGLNEASFIAQQRQNQLRDAVTGTAEGDLPVSRALVEAQFRHTNEQRDARYFVVASADSEVQPPTDDEIKAQYEANPSAYTAPEYRSLAVMKAEPADVAATIALSDADIAEGYEKYKTDYFTPEKRTVVQVSFPTLEEAQAAKAKLAAGTDIVALAKERGFSETDITFADKTKADFFDPAIAEAAFATPEGAVSDPVKGALATVLVKPVKVAPEHQRTLDEVKPELAERLKQERGREELQAVYGKIEDARGSDDPKFEGIAQRAGIPFLLIPATDAQGRGKDGKDIDMPHKAELLQSAFTSDVGVENDAISLDDGYVWYEVREVVPSALKPLEAVKDQARAQVIADKVRALTEDKAKKIIGKLKSGAKFEDAAAEAKATIQTAQGLKRSESDNAFDPAAVKALFAVPENGFASALEPGGKSAKVMQSQAVLLQAFDPASPDAKSISDQMKNAAANDLLTAYLGALQKDAGVTINEDLWRQIAGLQNQ